MTKKDYIPLAAAIKYAFDYVPPNSQASYIVQELCVILETDNPRFDRDKFLKACGF